jgi:hypothetical protein
VIRDGKPQDWWYGHYILLQASHHEASGGGAKRFGFVVIDREDWQVEPVLSMLGRTLTGALGLAPASLSSVSPEEQRRRTRG